MTFFWDTSALVPLIVEQQPFTGRAAALARQPEHRVISFVTDLEGRAAVERLRRDGSIPSVRILNRTRSSWRKLMDGFDVISFDNRLLEQATRLVEKYPLRTLDALQLASCKSLIGTFRSKDLTFVTADRRLGEVASSEIANVRLLES